MPYPEHWLLQFGGSLGGADEIWTCGIRMIRGGAASPLDEEEYLDGPGVDAVVNWFVRPGSSISSQATLEWVKFNEIGPDGRYADTVTHERVLPVIIPGGIPGGTMPYQACVVLTWRTNAGNRGPGTKGRIYSPLPVVTVNGANGLFDANQAGDIAASAAELLNDIDSTVGVGWIRPAIVSDRAGGVANVIDRVTVDNRVDIQRRRGNSLEPVQRGVDVLY